MTESLALALHDFLPADDAPISQFAIERARDLIRGCHDVELLVAIRERATIAAAAARHRKASLETINLAQEFLLRAERELGRFLSTEGKKPGNPQFAQLEQLELGPSDLGMNSAEAHRARQLASSTDEVFESYVRSVQDAGEKLTRSGAIAASSAPDYDSDEYYTPEDPWILAAREVMGGIDVDPCSCAIAQNWIRAGTFYTKRDNGLTKRWNGRVWMNRPYSNKLSKEFGKKFLEELAAKRLKQGISLQNATPATSMFQRFAEKAYVCLPEGRINFNTANGKTTANRYDSAFFYVGPRAKRFCEVFGEFGVTGQLARMPARLFKRATTATTEVAE